MNILERLAMPFELREIKTRKGGGGRDLNYVSAQTYQKRLDEVMGLNWQCEYTHVTHTGLTACRVGLLVDFEDLPYSVDPTQDWVWRSSGAGETNIEGDKGTFTDSFKRACAAWGIGRYLYHDFDVKNPPKWATPEGYIEIINSRKGEE